MRAKLLGIVLKLGLYIFIAIIGLLLFPVILAPLAGYLVTAALGTFAAAAVANAVVVRIFDRGTLADIGLHWTAGSLRNLGFGVLGGVGAALAVLGVALAAGAAEMQRDPSQPASLPAFLFVTALLLFGAIGEEMLFRGYGFQLLVYRMGPFATILPVSVLFALAHAANMNASALGLANTFGYGVVLGFAFVRAGDLWLPIGIHFGWNWMLPLFGVPLSGFKMGVTGFAMRWKVGALWSGGDYGPEASLLTSAVLVALLVYLVKAPIRFHEPVLASMRPEAPGA
ncbi:MAG: CPBP family intramembrane metalloprotease [Acidobacteria bacterium]|nr:CPBP family intramembrane metalloprotease [Acidobacteriota bacterium]MBI3278996.1 CPBP family intramembrane metalloprotease [Acidobacteriota bacterium]